MGSHRDGFHHRLPFVAEEEQCHLCRHRQPFQSCPLLPSERLHLSSSVGGVVYRKSCIFAWHPKKISSDRGSLFTSKFWQAFQKAIGTTVVFSTAYHPQTSGQVERVNQILEDMLRACVISFGMKWEECLPYADFSYNNSYQASLQAAPFEVLYGRKCRTPLNWSEAGERQLLGPDIVQEAEDRVKVIREHLKAAQSRQKAYYDKKHRGVEFKVGDLAYLKVSPLWGTHHFGIKGKLAR